MSDEIPQDTELQEPAKPREPGVHIPASATAKALGKQRREEKARLKKDRQLQIKKMNAAKEAMANRRALIKEKIAKGIPITEEELKVAAVRNKTLIDMAKGQIKMTAEPAIVVKPQTINALRVVVEQTAAKHTYNPIEGLLNELKDPDLSAKDRVAIHKTLLPFLMPQLGPAKEEHVQATPTAPKITIKSFQIAAGDGRPIHESKKDSLANAVEREEERPDAEAEAQAFEPSTSPEISEQP